MSWMPTPEPDTHVDPGLPFRPADPAEAAEAGRLCSAGLIRRVVADAFVAADVPDSPTLRARAAALVLPERLAAAGGIVGFASAAWVHAGWHPEGSPGSLDVMAAERVSPVRGVRIRQVGVSPEDVVTLEGLSLTSGPHGRRPRPGLAVVGRARGAGRAGQGHRDGSRRRAGLPGPHARGPRRRAGAPGGRAMGS
jgi:hypothetical protein